jgi:hypothetical protein
MPTVAPELSDDLLKVRRTISDTFVRDGVEQDVSLVRQFMIKFGCQFPFRRASSRTVFRICFSGRSSEATGSFLKMIHLPRPSSSAIFRDRPREIPGINGGLRIEWTMGSAVGCFFHEVVGHTRPRQPRGFKGHFGRCPRQRFASKKPSRIGGLSL